MKLKPFRCFIASVQTLLSVALLSLTLNNSTQSSFAEIHSAVPTYKEVAHSPKSSSVIWSGGFEATNWRERWKVIKKGNWGLENISVINDSSGRFSKVLRVRYPAGSASPSVSRKHGSPLGGAQFYADLGLPPKDALRLSYYVRFSKNFDFVKGGKLPGLFGGSVNSGGKIPDGTNGFSTRFMWRKEGDGEVYAYLPTSSDYGTSLDRGAWRFRPGTWHHLEQEIVLNQPGSKDGQIRVWVDSVKVLDRGGLTFRTTEKLQIEGIFFSSFFGGGDPSWATPKDVYVDFARFSVSGVNKGTYRSRQ